MVDNITVCKEIKVKVSQEESFNFHKDLSNISKVAPFFITVEINKIEYPIQKGSQASLLILFLGFIPIFDWKLRFIEFDEPYIFTDISVGGPFNEFEHTHQFIKIGNNVEKSIVRDTIVFSLGNNFLNNLAKPFISIALGLKLFSTKKALEKL